MIKRSTWIVIVLLGLSIAAYFLFKNRAAHVASIATPTAVGNRYLLDLSKDKLKSLRITSSTQSKPVQIERDNNGIWKISLPAISPADQSAAEAAETQLGALLIVTSLDTPPALADMGLTAPAYTLQLTLMSGAVHTLEIGNETPTGSGYYVRLDGGTVSVVSTSGIDPLTAMLTNPPYPATETPPPTQVPTVILESATPTLEAASPTLTTSPTP